MIRLSFFLAVAFSFCCGLLSAQKSMSPEEYIANYKGDAIKEMYLYKIPASITLAQGMLESNYGNSDLARVANNHFGIKCHKDWDGETYHQDDDAKDECFRKYKTVLESYSDHSLFLSTRNRYAALFALSLTDYKGWCYGLKEAGYATDPNYPKRLITLIEKYKLYEYDKHSALADEGADAKKLITRPVYKFNHRKFIVAKNGESLDKIAREFELEEEDLRTYNEFTKAEKIYEGQKIFVQQKRRRAQEGYHVVQRGETLRGIAQLHGIRLSALLKKNRLKPDDTLHVGDVLYLRGKKPKT